MSNKDVITLIIEINRRNENFAMILLSAMTGFSVGSNVALWLASLLKPLALPMLDSLQVAVFVFSFLTLCFAATVVVVRVRDNNNGA